MKKLQPAAVVAIRINTENLKAIDALAKRQNSNRTAVITNAFTAYIAQHIEAPKPAKPSARASKGTGQSFAAKLANRINGGAPAKKTKPSK